MGNFLLRWILVCTFLAAMCSRGMATESVSPTVSNSPPATIFEGVRVKVGDDISVVREEFATVRELSPQDNGGFMLRIEGKGFWVFFDRNRKVETIRLESPFRGSVLGIKIGDRVESLQAKLGKPIREPYRQGQIGKNIVHIYQPNEIDGVTFYVDQMGKVEAILVYHRKKKTTNVL